MEQSIKEQKGKKVRRLYLRLTEEELLFIKDKSKNYSDMSSFVLDAVRSHDARRGRNRIDMMIKFSELIERTDTSLSRIGNNVNQVAHAVNRLMISGLGNGILRNESFLESIDEAKEVMKELLLELRKLSNHRG